MSETERPKILFETGLPPSYHIPPEHVREDILIKSETTTRCPYERIAPYWSVEVGVSGLRTSSSTIWSQSQRPPGLKGTGIFDEKVELEVDGEEQPNTQ